MKNIKAWTIQKRFTTIFVTSTVLLGSFLVVFVGYILNRQLIDIENRNVTDNNNRVKNTYEYFLTSYEKKAIDWARWDDTYEFINDLNKEYIESNLVEETMVNINVDEMLFYDVNQRLVFSTASAATIQKEPDFPEDVETFFFEHQDIWSTINKNGKISGLIRSDDGVLLYTGQQILHSDGSGPSRGVLIFARYLGPWFTDQISTIAQIPVSFDTNNIDSKDRDNVYGHVAIPIHGSDSELYLKTQTKRDVMNNGRVVLITLFWFVLGLTVLYVILNYLILYKYVLLDINNFKDDVRKIAKDSGDGRLQEYGVTEDIDGLRSDVNHLLDILDKSRDSANTKTKELENLNRLMVDRELKMIELKELIKDLKKKII